MVRAESATKYHILQLHNWKKKIKKNLKKKKIQSHIKRKIGVPLEQEMDNDDDDDGGDMMKRQAIGVEAGGRGRP
jgi:hypothetical protein